MVEAGVEPAVEPVVEPGPFTVEAVVGSAPTVEPSDAWHIAIDEGQGDTTPRIVQYGPGFVEVG